MRLLSRPQKSLAAVITALSFITAITPLSANAMERIFSPNVTRGKALVEYGPSVTFDNHAEKNNDQQHELAIRYGLTDRMAWELSGEIEKKPEQSAKFAELKAAAIFEFFEPGRYWVDSGLRVGFAHEFEDGEADEVEVALLLEKQHDRFLHRANIGFEQEVGSGAEGGPDWHLLWSSRYQYNVHFEPGFEIQSNFGSGHEKKNFEQQIHYIGPAIYGQIVPNLNYEAVYYVGASDEAAQSALRFLVKYEMRF